MVNRKVSSASLVNIELPLERSETYIKTKMSLPVDIGLWNTKIAVTISKDGKVVKSQKLRLNTPQWLESIDGDYEFFTKWPIDCKNCLLQIQLENGPIQDRLVSYIELTQWRN